jgi:signal transduction histidine kinase/ActR/RegA family two-component response regulator
MTPEAINLVFPHEYLRAAMLVSLTSVWMLVGLFFYLNRYTKREYFTIWTAAWLFYALWLTLNLEIPETNIDGIIFICKQWCVAISAVFLLWGSLRFLGITVRQTLLGLFILFLMVWTFISPKALSHNTLAIQLPVFILIGLSSMFGSVCFYRLRKKMPFVGAGMLALGFLLWGLYLGSYPFAEMYKDLTGAAFFIAAVLQLFIAVSMIVLVLEEARNKAEKVVAEIAAVRSEKEALQVKVISTEEQCRNLYDQVRLADGLQKAYEELRRTQAVVVQQERLRALGQMASGVAHDINNALSPITGYSELLLNKKNIAPETAREYLQSIHKSAVDIAHIVARMRDFYRQRQDNEPLIRITSNELIKEVIGLTRPRWRDVCQKEGVSINIQPEFEEDMPPMMGDPTELREALINLIFNSLDAMPYGGTIRLITRSVNRPGPNGISDGEKALQIEVRDDGIGMDDKTKQRCLEPFFSTKTLRGGSGLGLSMVYGMMQRHGGTIDIESAKNKGTSIRLTFPLRKEPAKPVENVAPHEEESNRTLNVLCIDDEPLLLQLLNDCLTPFGHRITTAPNGQKGLDLFKDATSKKEPFEAVITDLGMPGLDGRQVAKAIKAESPKTPIIMLTGWGATIRQDKENMSSVDIVMEKPPDFQKLHETLLEVTNGHETEQIVRE